MNKSIILHSIFQKYVQNSGLKMLYIYIYLSHMLASMYIRILDIIFFTAELRQIVIIRNDTNIFQFVCIKISQNTYLLIHKCLIKNNKQ